MPSEQQLRPNTCGARVGLSLPQYVQALPVSLLAVFEAADRQASGVDVVLEVPAGKPGAVQATLPVEGAVPLGILFPARDILLNEAGHEGHATGGQGLMDQAKVGGGVLVIHVREDRVRVEDVNRARLGGQGALRGAIGVVALITDVDQGEAEARGAQVLLGPAENLWLDVDTVVVGHAAKVLAHAHGQATGAAAPVIEIRLGGQACVLLESLDVLHGSLDECSIILEVLTTHAVLPRGQGILRGLLPIQHDAQTTLHHVDELSRLRAELDVIDSEIVIAIGARLAKAREIGAAKAALGSVVRDPARERIVIEGVRAQAEEIGSNADLTQEVFTMLIHGALRVQNHDPSKD